MGLAARRPKGLQMSPAKTNAERQAAFRQRKATEQQAAEVKTLRTALRQEREILEARYMALLKAVADGRAMQPAPPILVDLGPNAEVTGLGRQRTERRIENEHP